MPRTVETVVYELEELPEAAKENARAWYRETCLEHEWYDAVFDDFETICRILGVTLRTSPVRLYGGGTRDKPHVWFRGFSNQGDGASFEGRYSHARGAARAIREALIGRVLDAEQVRAVRTSFGLGGAFAMTGAEAFEAVMGRGTALALANGWRLARRRIMGADRVEIEGPVDGDTDALKRMGCTVEIVSWRARAFAPAAHVLDRILERWPLAA